MLCQSAVPMTQNGANLDIPAVTIRDVETELQELLGKKRKICFDVHSVRARGKKRRALPARHHPREWAGPITYVVDRFTDGQEDFLAPGAHHESSAGLQRMK